MKFIQNIFRSWRTTLVGVLGFIAIWNGPLLDWLKQTTDLTPERVVALVLLVLGALAKDASKTGVAR